MKTKNRLSIMITLLVMIPLFISVVFAIWYISDFKMATPDNKKDNILTKYIDDQETIYDGNIQLPSPNVFENSIPLNTNDISYYFKINNSADEYVLCKENTTGPKNAGEYSVKVKYDLSYTDLTGQTITDSVEKVITFTIKKYKYELNNISFNDVTKVYNGQKQSIEISGTLPDGVTVSYDGGGIDVNSSPYSVTASFHTPDTINYEQIESKTANLTIIPLDITSSNIIISFEDNEVTFAYLESPSTPKIKVLFGNTELEFNKDFSVAYTNNTLDNVTARKTATANVSGIGNFTGTEPLEYSIVRYMYLNQDMSHRQEFVYNGTIQHPEVFVYSDASYTNLLTEATVTYSEDYKDSNQKYNSDNQTTSASYTIQVGATLTGYELFKEITVNYYILQKEIEIEWSSERTFTYNGSKQSPTATALGIISPDECDVNITGIGANANTYTVTASSLSNLNYKLPNNLTNKSCSYTINKAKVQSFNGTVTLNGQYIEGDEPTISQLTGYKLNGIIFVNGTVDSITGAEIIKDSIDYKDTKYPTSSTQDKQTAQISVAFKHSNSNYESPYVCNVDIDIYAVATIGSTYYGTVERALEASKSGDSVYLIPGRNPTIRKNTEIKSDVTLNIVYETGVFKDNRESDKANIFADTNEKDYLKNTLNIAEGIILTNNGNLKIDGVVGNAGQTYAGQTSREYTQILLDKNAKIESNNTIYCLGYIKEKSQNNNSQVNINQGIISAPLVIYDFKGGTNSSYLNSQDPQICPFKIYDCPNVQPTINIKAGAQYRGLTSLFMRDSLFDETQHHILQSNIYIIGNASTSNVLFILKTGILTLKYNRTDTDMKLTINGDCETGNLEITMKISGISSTLSTSNYYCPIPYKIKILIETGNFNIRSNTRLEFLPGSELVVGQNSQLSINANCIFYDSFNDTYSNYRYPSSVNVNQLPGAKFEVNGICNITSSFAGTILTSKENAQITITSTSINGIYDGNCAAKRNGLSIEGTMYYGICNDLLLGEVQLQNATLYAKGNLRTSLTFARLTNFAAGEYVSQKLNGNYVWSQSNAKIEYVLNNGQPNILGSAHSVINGSVTISSAEISNPTREHYTFVNWYLDEACTKEAFPYDLFVSTKVYAKWDPNEYAITYHLDGGTSTANPTTYKYGDTVTLKNDTTKDDLVFGGWYLDTDYKNQIIQLDSTNITKNTDLYVLWYPAGTITIKINYQINKENDILLSGDILQKESDYIVSTNTGWMPAQLGTNYNNNTYVPYWFDCWYTSSDYSTKFNSDYFIQIINDGTTEITLFAKVKHKNKVKYADTEIFELKSEQKENFSEFYLYPGQSYEFTLEGDINEEPLIDLDNKNSLARFDGFGTNINNTIYPLGEKFTITVPDNFTGNIEIKPLTAMYYKVTITKLENAKCTIVAANALNTTTGSTEQLTINLVGQYLFVKEGTKFKYSPLIATEQFSLLGNSYESTYEISYYSSNATSPTSISETKTQSRNGFIIYEYTYVDFSVESEEILI